MLYCDPSLADKVELLQHDVKALLTIRSLDEQTIREGLWLQSTLQRLADAHGRNDSAQSLKNMLRLRAMGWLHDESIYNSHGSDAFVWLDPLLLQEVHPRYLAELGALKLLEPLLDPMLLLATTDLGGEVGFSEAVFGGSTSTISLVNSAYWQVYATSIDSGEIPSFNSLMTKLWKDFPGLFQRY